MCPAFILTLFVVFLSIWGGFGDTYCFFLPQIYSRIKHRKNEENLKKAKSETNSKKRNKLVRDSLKSPACDAFNEFVSRL